MPVVREILTAPLTLYVRADGNDSNNGLTDNSAGAFRQPQAALDYILGNYDLGNFDITVQMRTGTYQGIQLLRPFVAGKGWVKLLGDTTTPSNVLIAPGTSPAGINCTMNASLKIAGLKISDTSMTHGLYASAGGLIRMVGNCEFGNVSSGAHIRTNLGGRILIESPYVISCGAPCHIWPSNLGQVEYSSAGTVSLTGTPNFPGAFAFSEGAVIVADAGNVSFSGGATGMRYFATLNGVIHTAGAGANLFPGNVAGSTSTGGQYN